MEITFAPRERLQIDNARITFRNFAGEATQFNREGDRNFALIINTQEQCDALIEQGWNVKIKPPREEGDEPFMYLPVKVKFNGRGPRIYLKSGNSVNVLDEESISMLDEIDIRSVDMDVRPYDWVMFEGTANEKTGRTAYLESLNVVQEIDRFGARYAEGE